MQTVWRDDRRFDENLLEASRASWCIPLLTGAYATKTVTSSFWADRRRDQRRWSPPGYARDRGKHLGHPNMAGGSGRRG